MKIRCFSLAVAAFAVCLNGHGAVVIDLFTVNQAPLTDTTLDGTGVESQVSGLTILGAYRDLSTNLRSGVGFSTINVSGGSLNLSSSAGTVGSGQVKWDGPNSPGTVDYTGLGGIDFLGAGAFAIDIATNAAFPMAFTIYTDALRWTAIEFLASAGSFAYTYPVSAFANPSCGIPLGPPGSASCGSGGPADLSNVGALVLDLNHHSTVALDASIGGIRVVPEPNVLSLLGIGLSLVGAIGVRRKARPGKT